MRDDEAISVTIKIASSPPRRRLAMTKIRFSLKFDNYSFLQDAHYNKDHLPIQNFEKILFKISSLVILPVSSPICSNASRRILTSISTGSLFNNTLVWFGYSAKQPIIYFSEEIRNILAG